MYFILQRVKKIYNVKVKLHKSNEKNLITYLHGFIYFKEVIN